jgi:natural product precursor
MKKSNKISLNNLHNNEQNARAMSQIKGGDGYGNSCGCGCQHAGNGGSSFCDNSMANHKYGLASAMSERFACWCTTNSPDASSYRIELAC